MAFTTTIDSTSNTDKFVSLGSQTTKFSLSHFEPPKFNIALAIHAYNNAVAFGPRDFAANEISTL